MPTTATPTDYLAKHYRARLLDQERAVSALLRAGYQRTWRGIVPYLQGLQRDLQAALDAGKPLTSSAVLRYDSAVNLLRALKRGGYDFEQMARRQASTARAYAAALGKDGSLAQLDALVPSGVNWTFAAPSASAMEALSLAIDREAPLGALFDGWGEALASGARQTLLTGLALGQAPRDVAFALAQAGQQPLQRALVIARDQMVGAYRQAALATYQANSDVVQGWVWVSSNSSSTCAACLFMDGSFHTNDETMDSHVCCRCSPAPATRSWADILSDAGLDASGINETSILANPRTTGAEWLAQQDAATQDGILGKTLGAAYRDGVVSLGDMVGTKRDAIWGDSVYVKSLKEIGLTNLSAVAALQARLDALNAELAGREYTDLGITERLVFLRGQAGELAHIMGGKYGANPADWPDVLRSRYERILASIEEQQKRAAALAARRREQAEIKRKLEQS